MSYQQQPPYVAVEHGIDAVILTIRPFSYGQEMRLIFLTDGSGAFHQGSGMLQPGAGAILDGFASVLRAFGRAPEIPAFQPIHSYPMPTNAAEKKKVMRKCGLCGFRADMYCLDCQQAFCYEHVVKSRGAWGIQCDSSDGHAFIPMLQKEGQNFMKSTNPKEATAEGKKLAGLLKKFVTEIGQDGQADFSTATALGKYLALDVLGYRDGEIMIAFVEGFTTSATATKTPDELSKAYQAGAIPLDVLSKRMPKALLALTAPQEDEGENEQ